MPSTNGSNGGDRGPAGRFAAGNAGGPGNPHAKRIAKLRSLLVEAVNDDDLRAIIGKLVEQAKAGDDAARRELLDRLLGRPHQATETTVNMTAEHKIEYTKKELDFDGYRQRFITENPRPS